MRGHSGGVGADVHFKNHALTRAATLTLHGTVRGRGGGVGAGVRFKNHALTRAATLIYTVPFVAAVAAASGSVKVTSTPFEPEAISI